MTTQSPSPSALHHPTAHRRSRDHPRTGDQLRCRITRRPAQRRCRGQGQSQVNTVVVGSSNTPTPASPGATARRSTAVRARRAPPRPSRTAPTAHAGSRRRRRARRGLWRSPATIRRADDQYPDPKTRHRPGKRWQNTRAHVGAPTTSGLAPTIHCPAELIAGGIERDGEKHCAALPANAEARTSAGSPVRPRTPIRARTTCWPHRRGMRATTSTATRRSCSAGSGWRASDQCVAWAFALRGSRWDRCGRRWRAQGGRIGEIER